MSDSSDANHNHDSDSDDQDLFDDHRRRQHRERARAEAIYGVFYDDDNHDSYTRRNNNNNNNNGGGRRSRDDGLNIAPQFVKGKAGGDDEEEKDGEYDDDEDDIFQSNNSSKRKQGKIDDAAPIDDEEMKETTADDDDDEDPMETEEDKVREEELKKKSEAANLYFMSLLKKGKGEKEPKPFSSSFSKPQYTSTPSSSSGLGFPQAGGSSGGLGFSAAKEEETKDPSPPSFSAAAGLGMQSTAGLGVPTAFGGSSNSASFFQKQSKPEPSFAKDPNLGTWEKHTKGIGMKLLAKMGYKGSGGLGSLRQKKKTVVDESTGDQVVVEGPTKKGISRPVEVVVRPNNLGLGFGNFKEATKLKNNQKIEAEVRGIDVEKKQKEEEAKKKANDNASYLQSQSKGESSALPSVQDLMQQQAWKRGAKQSQQKSRKRQRRTVIPYQELLEKHSSQPSVVIDMRGPSTIDPTSTTDGGAKEVPLGEELLHNVSLLLNTYENKAHSSSHFVRSTKQKVESLQSDISNMEQQMINNRDRVKKLKKVLETVGQIEEIVGWNKTASSDDIIAVQALVRDLQNSFTPEELTKLRFFDVLAPSLLEPIIQARLENWDPLQVDAKGNSDTMEAIIIFCKDYPSSRSQDAKTMMQTIFTTLLLPRVKKALESSRWDPIHGTEVGLQLYEGLCHAADVASPLLAHKTQEDSAGQIFPSGPADDDAENDSGRLKDLVQEQIIHTAAYTRLARALSYWKPRLDESGTGLVDCPNLWILPWIPHLDHRSILPTLLSDIKRKLKSAISFLHKNIDDDETFCQAALQTGRPWYNMFPKDILQSLVSTSVVYRLAKSVATAASSALFQNTTSALGCPAMDWKSVDMTFEMHSSGLISDNEMLSIIEGELLSRWAKRMQAWLHQEPSQWKEAAEVYIDWRVRLWSTAVGPSTSKTGTVPLKSQECLQRDSSICSVFYAVLLLIQAAEQSNVSRIDELKPTATSCRAVLARRMREEREAAHEKLLRMDATGMASGYNARDDPATVDAKVRAAQRHVDGHMPTFREVVEEFAREKDILFQPRMGANATKDGKPVFLFGTIPVYLESDVAFAYQKSEWTPTSLSQLAKMAQATATAAN